jgi:hypothetical protein
MTLEDLTHCTGCRYREQDSKMGRFWDVSLKLLVPLVLVLGSTLIAHEVRIARIEASDMYHMKEADLINMERRIGSMLVPSWLKEDIDDIKAGQKDIILRLRALEQRNK